MQLRGESASDCGDAARQSESTIPDSGSKLSSTSSRNREPLNMRTARATSFKVEYIDVILDITGTTMSSKNCEVCPNLGPSKAIAWKGSGDDREPSKVIGRSVFCDISPPASGSRKPTCNFSGARVSKRLKAHSWFQPQFLQSRQALVSRRCQLERTKSKHPEGLNVEHSPILSARCLRSFRIWCGCGSQVVSNLRNFVRRWPRRTAHIILRSCACQKIWA
jgi:hypothetical protein